MNPTEGGTPAIETQAATAAANVTGMVFPQTSEPRQVPGAGGLLDRPGDQEQGRLVQGVGNQECECGQDPPRRLARAREGTAIRGT